MPPPRTHRHRYFGVLAPHSPLRAAAVALAAPAKQVVVQTDPATTGEGASGVAPLGHAIPPTPESAPPKRSKAHYLWAVLIARIYEVFPLLCPRCGGQMRLIAFIHYRGRTGPTDFGSHRCRLGAATHIPGARATFVG